MSAIKVFMDSEAASRFAANLFVRTARESVAKHGRFAVALSGGSTPRRTYELLASEDYREELPWDAVHLFWGDERCVPLTSNESNAGEAMRLWLDTARIPESHIHPIDGTLKPELAAEKYEKEILQFFGDATPVFDLIFLGLGENGHTASLFPETPVLNERMRFVREVYVAEQEMYRVTLTASAINQAAVVAFLVFGGKKADVVREVLEGSSQPRHLPAQLINPTGGQLLWLIDESAASKIKESEYESIR